MHLEWAYLYGIFLSLIETATCIKCYQCDNRNNPSCGLQFKAYQFEAVECNRGQKCGLQRQQPLIDQDNFVGILRDCYGPGDLPGIDESDGCRNFTVKANNFTAMFCFCSEDNCNTGSETVPSWVVTTTGVLAGILSALYTRY